MAKKCVMSLCASFLLLWVSGAIAQTGYAPADPQIPWPLMRSPVVIDPADKAARPHCPAGSEWWDFVGAFKLKDRGSERLVAVYTGPRHQNHLFIGNFVFSTRITIHAIYQSASGKWVRVQEEFPCHRAGLTAARESLWGRVELEIGDAIYELKFEAGSLVCKSCSVGLFPYGGTERESRQIDGCVVMWPRSE